MSTADSPDAGVRITSAEAIPLAYVLAARVAREHGLRLLAIKGVVLAHHELRAPRVSADVDVLVDPDRAEDFADAMTELGWRRPPEPNGPRLNRNHAINLVNDHWPMGIDVHVYFPGFLAPDREVFDVLWSRRVELTLAGHPFLATDLSGSAAIAALHHLREQSRPDNVSAREALVEKARLRMSASDLADLGALASATGSVRPLEPFLAALGAPDVAEHPAEAAAWAGWLAASTAEPGDVWRVTWGATAWRHRPRFVWRAFQPDTERLRHLYMHDVTTPLWRLRVRRARYVLAGLPALVRGRTRS